MSHEPQPIRSDSLPHTSSTSGKAGKTKAKAQANAASQARSEKVFLLALLSLFVFIPSLFFCFSAVSIQIPHECSRSRSRSRSCSCTWVRIRNHFLLLLCTNESKMSRMRQTTPPSLISKIPTLLRFPLLVLSSLTLSSALYTFASHFTAGDLSSVSRSIDDWWQVAGLIGWKTAELAVGWWGEYDSEHSKDPWRIFLQKLI